MTNRLSLPSVHVLAAAPGLAEFPVKVRTDAARSAIADARGSGVVSDLAANAVLHAKRTLSSTVERVINGSGVVLHTGLGRARLATSAEEAVRLAASGHASVEIDLISGERGDRQSHVRADLCALTGAEDALVVNNCAAAVFLVLSALCVGREVVLSRGQMVEIGGSFRMPDIVRQSGCQLVEVGCTNKTHLRDFELALTEQTAAVLRCHPSNYKIIGFASQPSALDLYSVARQRGILLIDDQGSGCLVDTRAFGLPKMTTLDEAVAQADIVMASGDKMLGGPQAGIILGRKSLISQIRNHPLARAVRVDKLTLTGLAATLKLYRGGLELQIPTLAYLAKPLEDVKRDAERLVKARPDAILEVGQTEVGGGSAPGQGIPTWRVGFPKSPEHMARALRTGTLAILGRIERGHYWLDPRTMDPGEVEEVAASVGAYSSTREK